MHAVYSTLADITPADDIIPADNITLADDIKPADNITLANDSIPADITLDITPANTIFAQNNKNNQASYEFYTMQVKRVHEEILRNDETYQNKLVIHGSIHQRKLMFEPGDRIVII
ncbi:hypothetical protein F8M41_025767 [Gigaspora margarita]|uniref:Uncharacterized protein n=1 Tax=Gigaspora margarita TaxID=4874 RepID=A0A8H3XLC8_GIGMA|nr:hypothetical protein F8M41_025767 [Gigaspora margarita]